jgi:hypothetical protein
MTTLAAASLAMLKVYRLRARMQENRLCCAPFFRALNGVVVLLSVVLTLCQGMFDNEIFMLYTTQII